LTSPCIPVVSYVSIFCGWWRTDALAHGPP
jgi:hypothetical protein